MKDSKPCPYPPRVEREWERKHKNQKKWYNLSGEEKKEAELSMSKIYNRGLKSKSVDK